MFVAAAVSSWSCASSAGPAAPNSDWALASVGGPAAWTVTRGSGVTVAIIDSGVDDRRLPGLQSRDQGHLALGGGVDSRATPDPVGHGTTIASVTVGSGDLGVTGIAPDAHFISIAVTSTGVGSGLAALAAAVRLAVRSGAQVINLSLGSFEGGPDATSAIDEAVRANVVVIAAAGDTASSQALFPATLSQVIAVRALDAHGNAGPRANPVGPNGLDAPGSMIPAILLNPVSGMPRAGVDSGSSLAAAVVSGAVALLDACLRTAGRVATTGSILKALRDSAKGRTFFDIRTAMRLLGCAP